ncbi:amino acid adenylation domain-containing protein [Micromonospora sp. HK10]|uniref:non-ribosomal peptide synthetase n=1 Tax=Micromonospora sp. HK10 TaxID=1538294 RepID=UPI000695BF97|nr:non-ribosomal peptide synthetase [Micromonospora sp. HK10]
MTEQPQVRALPEPPELPYPPAPTGPGVAVVALLAGPDESLVVALAGLLALLRRRTGRRELLAEVPAGNGWRPLPLRLPADPTWRELRDLVHAATGDPVARDADAGTDAAAADSATAAASDTATADAGTGDAATADAGTADAGTADAGTGDAATADAGTGDGPAPRGAADRPVVSIGPDPLPAGARGELRLSVAADGTLTVRHRHAEPVAAELALLLARLRDRRDGRLSDLSLLDDETHRRSVLAVNATDTGYPRDRSVPELFAEWSARRPDAPALRDGDRVLSYRELDRRSNRLAGRLRALGVGAESLVGLCFADTAGWVVAALATLKAGAAYLPLDPGYPVERLALMCADARPAVLLHPAALADRLPADGTPRLAVDGATGDGPDAPPPVTVHPDQLAYVMYTSGSTGRPKGTGVSHRNIVRLVRDTDYLTVRPDDVMGQAATMSFDAATLEVWGALLNGACLADLDIDDVIVPDRLRRRLREQGVTMMFLATSVARQLATEAPDALAALRYLTFGGEQADPTAVRRLRAACPDTTLVNGYGPTEGTTYTTTYDCARLADDDPVVPIGGPVANTRVYVLDHLFQPVPPGVLGELFIGGDGVARGYLGRPGQTAETFLPDPFGPRPGGRLYRTGDLVRQRPDGLIEFVGRADQQVKIRGYRVEPGEVTAALRGGGLVDDAYVRADRDGAGDARLVAYVVPAAGADLPAIRARAREQLPDHLVPAVFVPLPALPLNRNGKVDAAALPDPGAATGPALPDPGPTAGPAPEAVLTPTERAVAEIWQDVLGVPVHGRDDDFFDLGGRSLKATRVRSRLSAAIGAEVPLRLVFDHPTVAALAAAADEIAAAAGRPVTVAGPAEPLPDGPPAADLAGLLDQLEHGAGAR